MARDNLSVFRDNKFLRHFFRDSKNVVRIRLADSTVFTYPLDLVRPLSTLINNLSQDVPLDSYEVSLAMFPSVKEEHFTHVDNLLLEFADNRYDLAPWARTALGRSRQGYVTPVTQDLASLELFAVVSYLGADFIMTKMESALVKELRRFTLEEPVLVSLETFFARHDYKQCLKEVTGLLYTQRRNRIKQFVQDTATNADLDAILTIIDNSEKATRYKKRKA